MHSGTVSTTRQCCVDGVSWNFWEDHTISKEKPIQTNPPHSPPFPDATTAFCQDGVKKQKMSWRINNDYSLLLSYPQIIDKMQGSIGIFTFEPPPQSASRAERVKPLAL